MSASDQPDPATFALPADAAVTSGGGEPAAVTSGGGEPAAVAAGGPSSGFAGGSGSGSGLDAVIAKLPVDPELVERRPEILVGGAFAGAFVLARILKRLTSE
jgi:hypothetical protein